jgi:hypothetical protein
MHLAHEDIDALHFAYGIFPEGMVAIVFLLKHAGEGQLDVESPSKRHASAAILCVHEVPCKAQQLQANERQYDSWPIVSLTCEPKLLENRKFQRARQHNFVQF